FSRVEFLYNQFTQLVEELRPARKPKFALSRMTFVGSTDGEALEAMGVVQVHHRIFTRLMRNQATVKGGFTAPEPVEDEYGPERLLANLVAGSPETCVEKLRLYEQLGVDHYIMYAGFPMSHAATMKSIRLFAERVMPC